MASGSLREASAIAYDAAGNLYIADGIAHRVFEATLGGALVLLAGTGVQGFAGDGGPAASAELSEPQGLAVGLDGTIYVADTGNARVRAVSPGGIITTYAGTGVVGFSGDGGIASAARLREPTGLGVDSSGALLICDTGNQRLRRVAGGVVSTVAGSGVEGFGGDGGPALQALFDGPSGVAAVADGRIFIADARNHRVRVVGPTGLITTFAGSGVGGFAGDGGLALAAMLDGPRGVAVDADGNVLIADAGNERVRLVSPAGMITTLAGSGVEGASTDGAAKLQAAVRAPRAMAVSSFGMAVVADTLNGAVRVVDAAKLYQPAALATGRTSAIQGQVAATLAYGTGSLNAAVTGTVGTPQGSLQLMEGSAALASSELNGGSASLDVSSLNAGTHSLVLKYYGDGLNPAVSSAGQSVSVSPLGVMATASSTTMAYGAALPSFDGVVSGVLPSDANQVSAVFGVSAGGMPAVGTYPLTATLIGPRAGNYTVAMSASSGELTVVKAGVTASMSSMGQAFAGIPVTLTASVVSSTSGQPTGTVQFLDGNVVVGTGSLVHGSASAVYTSPPVGSRALSVQYLGDADFLPGASAATSVSVLAMPDFSIAPTVSPGTTTTPGGTASFSLTVSAQPGPFTGAVTFSVAGLPTGATAYFTPPAVIPGTGSANVVVSVQTVAPATAMNVNRLVNGGKGCIALATVIGVFLGFSARRRCVGLLCFLGSLVFLGGCGARSVGEGLGGAIAQSYALSVTGTATNLAGTVVIHSTALTLTVQQAGSN